MTHLVLFLVLAAAVQSGACPIMCTCKKRPQIFENSLVYQESVSCGSFGENITQDLSEELRDLTFSGLEPDQLEMVISELLEEEIRFPHLVELTITKSVLGELINLTFTEFPKWSSITFFANTLPDFSQISFNTPNLKTLQLSNNAIVTINNSAFRTLDSLEDLNLSSNSLSSIDSGTFCGLSNLKYLDLSGNNFTNLNDSLLVPLQSLQFLNLSQNQLETLNEKCFISLVKLQQLDLSHNRLIHLELDSLQLPSLARLLLAGNSKLGLSVLLVGTGQRLQTVDASQIGLKQVPAALTHSIRTLRLVENSIKTVRSGDLDSYPLLQLLDFTSNNLEFIEDDALGRLDSLTLLYLTNNTLKEIPKRLSEKLKVLHLEQNTIERVGEKDLQGLSALEVLLLNDNNIDVIEDEAFNQLTSLVTLDLSRNPIQILDCLSGSLSLQVLRLSSLAITSINEVPFPVSSPERLMTLDLSKSPSLARQFLQDTAALAASRELQELDLSNTELAFIRSDLLHFLPQLRIFHLIGNSINCTQLEWLATWMRRQAYPEYQKIICSSPPDLWGTPLIDFQDNEIAITPEKSKTNEINQEISREHEFSTMSRSPAPDFFFNVSTGMSFNISETHNYNLNKSLPQNGEMSMFSAENEKEMFSGELLIVASGTAAVFLLIMLALRFISKRRAARKLHIEELEVSNLPGVTELW